MKAVRIHEYGGPEVLRYEDAPQPTIKSGEVLVRVHAAGVNPVDWKTREGKGVVGMLRDPLPLILGWDISGIVEAIAPDVTEFQVGDDVFGMVNFPQVGSAYAEYVAAPVAHLARKPQNVSHIEAGASPLAALTAHHALFAKADLQAGQTVLIHAAAGGVGSLAVQFAKWKGAHVIGTASAENADFARSLGVDEVIDYKNTRFEEVVAPVDVVIDTVGGEVFERSWAVVKRGGVLVTIAAPIEKAQHEQAQALGIRAERFLVKPDAAELNHIAALMESGDLKIAVGQVFPLQDAARAHTLSEGRHLRGKIALDAG